MEQSAVQPVHSEPLATGVSEDSVGFSNPEKWRHISITVTRKQREAFLRLARLEGASNRAFAQTVISAWLRKPTLVQPVTASPDRLRLRVNIGDSVHARLSAYAAKHNITMTAVAYTAIARHLDR